LPVDSLRFVDTDPANGAPRVRAGSAEVFAEVAATLGVLPDAAHQENVRVAVAVEGPTDVDALISLAEVLVAAGDIDGFDQTRVFWTMGGGSTLKDWVERRYLDSLNIPQVFIFDSDQTSSVIPPSQDKVDRVAEINGRPNCQAFLSRKRTIENYIDVAAVGRISQNRVQIAANVDPDYGNIADAFASALKAGRLAHGQNLNFHPVDHDGSPLPLAKCKKILTAYVMRNMTADEVRARGAFIDGNGAHRNEILDWLLAIRAHI
jgi:hypothetical protein